MVLFYYLYGKKDRVVRPTRNKSHFFQFLSNFFSNYSMTASNLFSQSSVILFVLFDR